MDTSSSGTTELSVGDQVAFLIVSGLAGLLGLFAVIDGTWRTIALAVGDGPVELFAFTTLPDNIGDVTRAIVTSSDIDESSRTLLVASSVISLIVTLAISVAIVAFLVLTAYGRPFHRSLFPLLLTTGLLMSVGGMVAAGLDGLGRMMAGGELGEPYEAAFEFGLGPWAFGFVVLVAAYVVGVGTRLQRETDGLV